VHHHLDLAQIADAPTRVTREAVAVAGPTRMDTINPNKVMLPIAA
jgi:hypothetical protein